VVSKEVKMKQDTMKEAQDYLTVNRGNGGVKLVDLEFLFTRLPPAKAVEVLYGVLDEYKRMLKELVLLDKTSPKINDTIAKTFRVHMAIRTLESGKEVKIA
jgi:hypothetical protein